MPTDRIRFLKVGFDRLSMADVLARLRATTPSSPYGYVVTPNVDHVVRLNDEAGEALQPLYDRAAISVCDSRILRILARLRGIDLPLVPGSDLTRRVLEEVIVPGDRIAIVGGDAAMVDDLRRQYPNVDFLHDEPPMGLARNAEARLATARFIAASGAKLTFIAVGSPQQEMVAADVLGLPGAGGIALCIGASLDFLTGRQTRAPRLLQKLHLEWAHRLATNPRRMWRRYLVEGPKVFLLAARFQAGDRR